MSSIDRVREILPHVSRQQAETALRRHNNNVEAAIETLLTSVEFQTETERPQQRGKGGYK